MLRVQKKRPASLADKFIVVSKALQDGYAELNATCSPTALWGSPCFQLVESF